MSQSSYYIGLEDPKDIRRDILESAKHSVAILKQRHKISEIRGQRHDKVAQIKQKIADMNQKVKTLKEIMPSHSKSKMPDSLKVVEKRLIEKEQREARKEEIEETVGVKGTLLSDVHGVGPARVDKLNEAGIHTAEQLASASASLIARKTGIVKGMAQNLIEAAQKRVRKAGAAESPAMAAKQPAKESVEPKQEPAPEQEPDEMDLLEEKLADIERKLNNL